MKRETYIALLKLVAIVGTILIILPPVCITFYVDMLIFKFLGIDSISGAFDIQATSWWVLLIFWYIQSLFVTFIGSIFYYTSKIVYKHRDLFLL